MNPPDPDRLNNIFMAQAQLMKKFDEIEASNGATTVDHTQWGDLDDRQVQMRLKDLSQRTIEELCEATHLLRNRPWKQKYHQMTPEEIGAFREEVADALHFFIELCITAGIDSQDLYELYIGKAADNMTRIGTGV